jgi:ADP-ribose pyrophosphatase YjhB (NUDIX family)
MRRMDEQIFKYISIEVAPQELSGLFTRGGDTVAILLRNGQGQWVLGKKTSFYPEGIARMVGGGMDQDKNPSTAAVRELREETGLVVEEEKLVPLVHAEVTATLADGTKHVVSIFVFYLQTTQPLMPADDVDGFAFLSDRELLTQVDRYLALPEDALVRPGEQFSWAHYGQIWGPVHAASFGRVKELGL